MVDPAVYSQKATQTFRRILDAADRVDPDKLDAESTGDMITLTASSGEKCVINTQRAVSQIWVAGKGQGIHFDLDPATGEWKDDKGKGYELLSFIADVVREISGEALDFR